MSSLFEIFIDGASLGNPGSAGVGVVIIDDQEDVIKEFSRPLGIATNNVAEYLALIYAMLEASKMGCKGLRVKTDSQLLARQVNGQYKVRDVHLRTLYNLASYLIEGFEEFKIEHVPREFNKKADRLAGLAAKAGDRE